MQYDIQAIKINGRHRKDLGNIDALAESIATIGLLHPVVIKPDGTLIAGERRLAAYKRLSHDQIPVTIAESLDDVYRALRAERDENVCRKDFAPSEAVEMARMIEPYEREAADMRLKEAGYTGGKRLKGSGNFSEAINHLSTNGRAADKTAAAVGLSRPTLRKAQEVVEAAEEAPDLFGDLVEQMDKNGKVDRAHKEYKKRQRQQEATAKATQFAAIPRDDRYRLICSDVATLDLGSDEVDVIITDPPYPQEYLPVYKELAHLASYSLKPGGSMFVMIGQSYLPDILALMTPIIRYHWTVAYLTPGGQAVQLWDRNVNTFWKPVLWFVNGDYTGPWIGDVARSSVNDNDKRFHNWGQSESGMADLIERFSQPNDVILDPFCGGGTTGVVALALNRRFIGADKNEQEIVTTQHRLIEVCNATANS